MNISIPVDDVISAEADLLVDMSPITAIVKKIRLFAELPEFNWKSKRIERILFEDGTVWDKDLGAAK